MDGTVERFFLSLTPKITVFFGRGMYMKLFNSGPPPQKKSISLPRIIAFTNEKRLTTLTPRT